MNEPGGRADPDIQPPFEVIEPERLSAPLVFDSPHSGARYPSAFLAASRLDPLTLRRSEDAFVDELFLPCVALGAPLLRARFPRAYLDVNREPFELDPRMFDGPLPDTPTPARCGSRRAWERFRASSATPSRSTAADSGRRGAGAHRRLASPLSPAARRLDRAHARALRRRRSSSTAIRCPRRWRRRVARHRPRRSLWRQRGAVGDGSARTGAARARLSGPAQQALRRRLHHRTYGLPAAADTPCRSKSTAPFTWTRRAW